MRSILQSVAFALNFYALIIGLFLIGHGAFAFLHQPYPTYWLPSGISFPPFSLIMEGASFLVGTFVRNETASCFEIMIGIGCLQGICFDAPREFSTDFAATLRQMAKAYLIWILIPFGIAVCVDITQYGLRRFSIPLGDWDLVNLGPRTITADILFFALYVLTWVAYALAKKGRKLIPTTEDS